MKIPSALLVAGIACLLPTSSFPAEARFLQVDPVGYQDQTNLYAYVGNDPVNRSDPTGLTCVSTGERDGKPTYSCRVDAVLA